MVENYAAMIFQFAVMTMALAFLLCAMIFLTLVGYCGMMIVQWIWAGGMRAVLPQAETRSDVAAPTDQDMWQREQEEKLRGR